MNTHYFSEKQDSSYIETSFKVGLRGYFFTFTTAPGVFSLSKIDNGSLLLIEEAIISEDAKTILDLGCGYGPVGIAIAKSFPDKKVIMSDVNERAVQLSKKNIKQNNIENAEALQSDGFEKIKENFDVILLNPPQTAGKKICEKLIQDSFHHLNKSGTLQIVARHQKGGKALSEYMQSLFGNLETVAKAGGYRVYKSVKMHD